MQASVVFTIVGGKQTGDVFKGDDSRFFLHLVEDAQPFPNEIPGKMRGWQTAARHIFYISKREMAAQKVGVIYCGLALRIIHIMNDTGRGLFRLLWDDPNSTQFCGSADTIVFTQDLNLTGCNSPFFSSFLHSHITVQTGFSSLYLYWSPIIFV